MEQTLIDIRDLSNIKFVSNYKNTDVLDLSKGNIYNINKSTFSETLSKFIKLDFGRNVVIKNIKLFGFSNNNIKYRIHNKLHGIPIYKLYDNDYYDISSDITDTSNVSNIVLETQKILNLPNKISYYPRITDKLFYVNNFNYNIKWSWEIDIPSTTYRYSTSLQEGIYDISGLNNQLNNLIFDIKYGPRNAFKNKYPLALRGSKNYPNFTLSFYNSSNFNIIIYSDSSLFDLLTIKINSSFIVYANTYYTIEFTYLPYNNEYLFISYNNTNIYDDYNVIYNINNFFDKLPEKDHSGNIIDYTEEDITKEIYLERKSILDISDNTAIRISQTKDETSMGIYTILGELSCNSIETIIGTHDNSIIGDISTNNIEIENYLYTNTIDSSFIDTYNISITNDICGNNLTLSTNNVKVHSTNFSDLDFSNNTINLYNSSKNFNLNKNKYKLIIFNFNNPYKKNKIFNNFKFNDVFKNNPLFKTYLLDNSNNYYCLGSINTSYNNLKNAITLGNNITNTLNITIPYIEDLSKIVFEFEESQSRGLFFSYEPIDNNKIFVIDDSNNCIYYEKNDPSFVDISAVIRYKIPNGNYNLYELNNELSKKPIIPLPIFISPDNSGILREYVVTGGAISSYNTYISNSYSIVNKYKNNEIPADLHKITYNSLSGDIDISNTSNINIFGQILDPSLDVPIRSYEEYDKYTYNQNKLIFFVKNDNLDFSYTILNNNDLSNSFFNYFFEEEISFIIPSDISDNNTKYFDLSNILNISPTTTWDIERDGNNIDILSNDSSGNNGGNIFASLLTIRNEFNNNLNFDLDYVNDNNINSMDISGVFANQNKMFKIYSDINFKNFYFLKNTQEYITNYNNIIYYGISYEDTILAVDASNLIYLNLDKYTLTDNSSNIHQYNNYVHVYEKLFIKELSCNDISFNIINSPFLDFTFNSLHSNDVYDVKSIKIKYDNKNIFNNENSSNIYLAYFNSINTLNYNTNSGNRMLITNSELYDGWCIKMDPDKKNHNSLDSGTLEFTSNFYNDVSSSWFNINASTTLTNMAHTSLNDRRFTETSSNIEDIFNNIDIGDSREKTLFPGADSHLIVVDRLKKNISDFNAAPPNFLKNDERNNPAILKTYFLHDDISYNSVIQDIILKLFPIKFKNNKTGFIETGYNLYDISNNISKINYLLKDEKMRGFSFNSLIPYICRTIQEISDALNELEDKIRQAGYIIE